MCIKRKNKLTYAAEQDVFSYRVLQTRLEVCYGFLGDFGLYLEEIRFRVTSLCFPSKVEGILGLKVELLQEA